MKFEESNYNYLHKVVQETLSCRVSNANGSVEVICKKCHRCLHKKLEVICKKCHRCLHNKLPKMPRNSLILNICSVQCVCCFKDVAKRSIVIFDIDNYSCESNIVKCVSLKISDSNNILHYICTRCNIYLKRQCLVTCCMYQKQIKHYWSFISV